MKYVCIGLVELYRRFLSKCKTVPTCRFEPSCSAYSIEAFREWGFFGGLFLTIRRVLRCNPFSKGGYDPVPKRRKKESR